MIRMIRCLKNKHLWLLIALMPISSLYANSISQLLGSQDGPLPAEQAFVLQYQQIKEQLTLRWTIEDDYYLYQDKLSLVTEAGVYIPLTDLPTATPKNDPLFGDTLIYTDELFINITLPNNLLIDDVQSNIASLTLAYQGCWEGGVCYPVQRQRIPIDTQLLQSPTATIDNTQNALANAPTNDNQTAKDSVQWYVNSLNKVDFWVILVVFWLAGIGLSFTPCVLPMVPILSNIIVGIKPKPSLSKSFLLSLAYVLAMALTYSSLGALVGLSGGNLQKYIQHPWAISGSVLLFLILSGAMFGFYSLSMPASWQTRFNNLSNRLVGGQYWAVFLMGIISALVIGPCVTAPLAGALLYIGQTGYVWLGTWALFCLGIGMGTPLLLVGMGIGHWVPKAGAWTERIKIGFGYIMLYMALWMLDRIAPDLASALFMVLTFGLAGVFWRVGRWQPSILSRLGLGVAYIVALLLTIYSISLSVAWFNGYPLRVGSLLMPQQLVYSLSNNHLAQDLATSRLDKITLDQLPKYKQEAFNNKQPMMLDVYADWCISCQELDAFIYPNKQVQAALVDYAAIKLDITEVTPEVEAFLREYNLFGPPALLLFDHQGQWQQHLTLVGVPEVSELVKALQTVVPVSQ